MGKLTRFFLLTAVPGEPEENSDAVFLLVLFALICQDTIQSQGPHKESTPTSALDVLAVKAVPKQTNLSKMVLPSGSSQRMTLVGKLQVTLPAHLLELTFSATENAQK